LNNKGGGVPGGRLSRRSGDRGLRRAVPEGERPGNRGADCQHPDEGPRRHVGSPADRITVGRRRDRSAAKRIRPRDAMTPSAYGLTRSAGTRKPSPLVSRCGGRTWSYQPPQSSYATRKAELFHDLLAMSELTSPRTNRWPVARLPGGCSLAPDGVK